MNESKMFMSSTICVNACRSSSPDESESTDANIAFTAAAPADEPPAPSRPPMSAAVSFRRRSKFGSFNEGDSVIRTQPLRAAPHPDTYDPEDYPAELGHHFRPLVYKLADAVADALAE